MAKTPINCLKLKKFTFVSKSALSCSASSRFSYPTFGLSVVTKPVFFPGGQEPTGAAISRTRLALKSFGKTGFTTYGVSSGASVGTCTSPEAHQDKSCIRERFSNAR